MTESMSILNGFSKIYCDSNNNADNGRNHKNPTGQGKKNQGTG